VSAGDPVVVTHRPDHGVTIGQLFTGLTPEQAQAVLSSGRGTRPGGPGTGGLAPKVVRDVSKVLARATA
jgi:hypothetical protein